MGKFTLYDNPAVDQTIQKDLDLICHEILAACTTEVHFTGRNFWER